MKELNFKNLSIVFAGLYITTIFVFNYHENLNIISQIMFILMFAVSLIHIFASDKKIYLNKFYLYIILLILISSISLIWSLDYNFALSTNITFIQLLLLMIIMYNVMDDISDVRTLLQFIFVSGFLMSIYTIVYYGMETILDSLNSGIRLGGEINQENALGFYANITIIIGLYFLIAENKKRYILYLILPLLLVFVSGSRKAILSLFLILPLSILLHSKNKISFKLVLSILIFYALLYFVFISDYSNTLFGRTNILLRGIFFGEKLDNSSETRFHMIEFGWSLFKEKPLLGYGPNQYNIYYLKEFGVIATSHNNYIQVLVSYGIIGFLVYYSLFIYIFIKLIIFRKDKLSLMLLILILYLLIHDFGAETFKSKLKYIILTIACFFVSIKKTKLRRSSINEKDYQENSLVV